MSRHWGSLEEIEAHVFEEYGRTMFEVQRFEFALERLVAQGTKRPEGKDLHGWLEEIRRMSPGRLRSLIQLPQSDRDQVKALLDVRNVFAHELLLAGKDHAPRFDPALARELIADMRALADSARELREKLEAEWSRWVREQRPKT